MIFVADSHWLAICFMGDIMGKYQGLLANFTSTVPRAWVCVMSSRLYIPHMAVIHSSNTWYIPACLYLYIARKSRTCALNAGFEAFCFMHPSVAPYAASGELIMGKSGTSVNE